MFNQTFTVYNLVKTHITGTVMYPDILKIITMYLLRSRLLEKALLSEAVHKKIK